MKTFNEAIKELRESRKKYTTFEEAHYKDLVSYNDLILLLEDVGFKDRKWGMDEGYVLNFGGYYGTAFTQSLQPQYLEVYLKKGYLKIQLTPGYIILDIYRLGDITFTYNDRSYQPRLWNNAKKVMYTMEQGLEEIKKFFLISICRDSFLDPEEERYTYNDVADEDNWTAHGCWEI